MSVATPDNPAVAAEGADECYRCGYALHGIADDQPCPECGLLAVRSRGLTDELHDAHPRWLRGLSVGTWLILASLLLVCASPYAREASYAYARLTKTRGWSLDLILHARMAALALAAGVFAAGVWRLTRPEGDPSADRADRRQRRVLRLLSLVPLASLLIYHADLTIALWQRSRPIGSILREWTLVGTLGLAIGVIGGVTLPLLLFRRFRVLATRARSAHLAEHCTIVGIGTSAALLYAAVATVYLGALRAERGAAYLNSRSMVPTLALLTMQVASLLFLIWSLYLMVRFAIAFGVAAHRLKARWRRADRSVLTAN